MDGTLVAYGISFVSVLLILYWKMRRQFLALLESKQKSIQEALETAEYIKNFSLSILYEETKKNGSIEDEVKKIQEDGHQQIKKILKEHHAFQEDIKKRFLKDLDEHIKHINTQFIQDMKIEISQVILERLRHKIQNTPPSSSPVQIFMERMKTAGVA